MWASGGMVLSLGNLGLPENKKPLVKKVRCNTEEDDQSDMEHMEELVFFFFFLKKKISGNQ